MPKKPIFDSKLWRPRELARIALDADVDPKTVARYLDGKLPMQPGTRARIEAALKAAGKVKP